MIDRLTMIFLLATLALPAVAASPEPQSMPVAVSSAQEPLQGYDGGELRMLVPSSQTGGAFTVVELNEASGYRTPPHVHPSMDESFYVLEGTLDIQIADQRHRLPAGSFVHIPRGTPHAQGSADDKPVRLLARFSPGGFEGFFIDRVALARTVSRTDADFQPRIMEIVGKYADYLQPAELPQAD